MAVEVILPKVDMDMATGKVSRWLVKEGAAVKQGDLLFEIETDKAAMEVEAPASGILGNVTGKEGVDVPVGQAVAWIFAEGETPHVMASAPTAEAARAISTVEENTHLPPPTPPPEAIAGPGAVRATPLARRLAAQAKLDLARVSGSGPHGRIVRGDIEAAVASRAAAVAAVPSPAPSAFAAGIRKLFAEGSFSEVPHDSMRRTIARRLTEAKSTVPHFYVSTDCRIEKLLALRMELNAAAPMKDATSSFKLSINDMIIKAWALALRDVPAANVSWTDETMLHHAHADIGIAVSVPGGLITPIIRSAEIKMLPAISAETRDLVQRARSRKLKPAEYTGGSTAISNLGMFGVRDFAAIINPPHATILAVGSGEQRAVVENGAVVAGMAMSVTLSTDHRAVDGALAAEVLASFRGYIERPLGMLF